MGLKIFKTEDDRNIARWYDIVSAAEQQGVSDAKEWDVRSANTLLKELGINAFNCTADLIDTDPRTGENLTESDWFVEWNSAPSESGEYEISFVKR